MIFTDNDITAILDDRSKLIAGDISWSEDEDHSPCVEFRAEIRSDAGYPLFVKGSHNPVIKATTFSIIHRGVGRIYGLCLGKDHHNPTCENVGLTHKHRWDESLRDKHAYAPHDIAAAANQAQDAWAQFCAEANIMHQGSMLALPPRREETSL